MFIMQNAALAAQPPFLKDLTDPLADLLGVPILARESTTEPCWPDPGHEAHAILHREFPEQGPCPLLRHPLEETCLPLDGRAPITPCPLGLTARRFAIALGQGRCGVVIMGPYFTRQVDRAALFGRSKAADAALALLPYLSKERQTALAALCAELAELAGSAVQAGAVKETFLANMSHELRTPLNGVMGMLSLVLQGDLAPRQRNFLSLAMDAAHQLLSLVNDLLELHHLSSDAFLLTAEPFGLRRELAPLLSAWAEEAERRGLGFAADIRADVPDAFVGDPFRLKQVLHNLVQNALQFTEQGGIGVRVSRLPAPSEQGTSTLLFAVRDTGVGIPPDRQQRIFERFAIGEDFLRKRHGNVGIGLAISKEIVEKMGGQVDIESAPGRGSVFSFTAHLRQNGHHLAEEPDAGTAPGSRPVILVAEEEPVSRLLVCRILEDGGHAPIVPEAGHTFLDVLRQRPVDLLLLDSRLASWDVPAAVQRIRDGQEANIAATLPIVLLTPPDAPEQTPGTPADGWVRKPVTRRDLLATVERILRGHPRPTLLKPHCD